MAISRSGSTSCLLGEPLEQARVAGRGPVGAHAAPDRARRRGRRRRAARRRRRCRARERRARARCWSARPPMRHDTGGFEVGWPRDEAQPAAHPDPGRDRRRRRGAAVGGRWRRRRRRRCARRGPRRSRGRRARPVRLLAREGEAARPADPALQRRARAGGRQAGVRRGRGRLERRGRVGASPTGDLQPVAWSPASSLWGRLLNFEADRQLAPDENPSIVRTPLVIAMWEPFARGARLAAASRSASSRSSSWRARTRASPRSGIRSSGASSSCTRTRTSRPPGLEAVVAEYYAATGKKEGLTEEDVESSKARAIVRDIERSIVHYGDTTLFIADQMRKEGPGYASAVAMEEVTLLDFNRNRGPQPKLVALYPPEGTFYSDNPFIVLDAPWVRPAQRAGRRALPGVPRRGDHPGAGGALGLPACRPRDGAGGAGLEGERRRSRAAGARARPARAAHARPHPARLARGPQARERAARGRHVGLDERREPARARQGGARRVLRARSASRTASGSTIFSDQLQPLLPIAPVPRERAAAAARPSTT